MSYDTGVGFAQRHTDGVMLRNVQLSVLLMRNTNPLLVGCKAGAKKKYDVHVDGAKDSRLASGISRLGNCSSQVQIHSHVFARPAFALL